jgi:hypothetical protein
MAAPVLWLLSHSVCERNGTSDSCLSRATTLTAFPLTMVAFGQSRGSFSVVGTTVAGEAP